VGKAKTHKGRLYLKSKEAKIVEDSKNCAFINSNKSNEILRMALCDLFISRRDFAKKLGKKNDIKDVFTSPETIEFLSERNNCALFTTVTDLKKRPMNLIMGNLFESKILDLFEFEITNFLPIEFFKDIHVDSCMKPLVIFQGDVFETDFEFARIKKFFFEFFKLYDITDLNVSVLKRLVILSAAGDKIIKIRCFELNDFNEFSIKEHMQMKETGPSFDLKVRRIKLANQDMYKLACRQPKEKSKYKSKNESTNVLGEKRGRVYMTSQDLNKMSLKQYGKRLARKRKTKEDKDGAKEGTNGTEGAKKGDKEGKKTYRVGRKINKEGRKINKEASKTVEKVKKTKKERKIKEE